MALKLRWLYWAGINVGILVGIIIILGILLYTTNTPKHPIPATAEDDPSVPHVTIQNITFHAETFGNPENPVVIVIHGGPGGDYRNLLILKALAEDGYFVVFYDQRGSGLSPRVPKEDLTFESSIEDLNRIVNYYSQGREVGLIGHSWGGIMTAYYLAKYPEKVARAVLAEPGVLTTEEFQEFVELMQPPKSFKMLLFMMRTWFASLHLGGPDQDARMDYIVHQVMTYPGDHPLNAYWCGSTPPPEASLIWRIGTKAMQAIIDNARQPDGSVAMPSLDGLQNYTDEVLIIASECNTLIGIERQRAHQKLFPNARLEIIKNAGHLMFTDQPETSLRILSGYLGAISWPPPNREKNIKQ
jgi:proline iminopeptidase